MFYLVVILNNNINENLFRKHIDVHNNSTISKQTKSHIFIQCVRIIEDAMCLQRLMVGVQKVSGTSGWYVFCENRT